MQKKTPSKLASFYNWVITRDYTNPTVLLSAGAIIILPMVAKYLVLTGLLLGIIHALGLLLLIEKCPDKVKRLIQKYPVASDIVLSFGAVYLVGSMFGEGLTLGLGALFCTLIMSLAIPHIKFKDGNARTSQDGEETASAVAGA